MSTDNRLREVSMTGPKITGSVAPVYERFDLGNPPEIHALPDGSHTCGPLHCLMLPDKACGWPFPAVVYKPSTGRGAAHYRVEDWPSSPKSHPATASRAVSCGEMTLPDGRTVKVHVGRGVVDAGVDATDLVARCLAGDWGEIGQLADVPEVPDKLLPLGPILSRGHRNRLAHEGRMWGSIQGRYVADDGYRVESIIGQGLVRRQVREHSRIDVWRFVFPELNPQPAILVIRADRIGEYVGLW
jgi:hypothetical protein